MGRRVEAMRRRLPKWCSEYVDRHGRVRVRFRRKGQETYYFRATAWTPDFMQEYEACKAKTPPGVAIAKVGTFSALIASYYRSPEFVGLAPTTQRVYRYAIEKFRAKYGTRLVATIQRAHIKGIVAEKSATPTAANHLLDKLKVLMNFACDMGLRKDNPTHGLRGFKTKGDGFHSWTEAEISQFEARHPIGSKPRLALALALYTAQRRSDILRMGRQHIAGGKIAVKQAKTGARLDLPVHPTLQAVLAETPRDNLTFLVNGWGRPFAPGSLTNWFRRACVEAGLPHCSLHGLRKAAARRLAEAGCTAHQIAAMTGHTTLKEVEHYTKAAEQSRLAEQAQTKMANQSERVANLPAKPLKRKGA